MAWLDVCEEGSIADGGHALVDIGGGMEVAVFRVRESYYAIEDICSHDDGPLAEGEVDMVACQIICPRHGARFDLKTGEAVTLPAYRPIEVFPVTIRDGRIWVDA